MEQIITRPHRSDVTARPYDNLAAGLDLVRRGYRIFPLGAHIDPGPDASEEAKKTAIKVAKKPALGFTEWEKRATINESHIRRWAKAYPRCNWGIETTELLAFDIDPHKGGDTGFAALSLTHDFPETATTTTWRGGTHLIYRLPPGVTCANSVEKIAVGVDVRSFHGYLVAPGSVVDGKQYQWRNEAPPTESPDDLISLNAPPPVKSPNAAKRVAEEDEWSLDTAWAYICDHAAIAPEGHRNSTCLAIANVMFDYAVTIETAVDYATEWSRAMCLPPLDQGEIETTVRSAAATRTRPIGYRHPTYSAGFDPVEIAERKAPPLVPDPGVPDADAPQAVAVCQDAPDTPQECAESAAAPNASEQTERRTAPPDKSKAGTLRGFDELAPPFVMFDPVELPEIPWVIENFIARRTNVLLVGPGGASKSTYQMQVMVALVTGRGEICGYPIHRRQRVWLWNQEDDKNQMWLRLASIKQAFDVSWDDLRDENGDFMFRMESGLENPLSLVERDRNAPSGFKPGKNMPSLIASVKKFRADLVSLDPFVSLHWAPEKENTELRAVMQVLATIGVECDCGVLISHHTPKDVASNKGGFAGNVNAARGGSSIADAARGTVTLVGMSEDEKNWKIPAGESHSRYVRLDDARMSLCPMRDEPWWFKRESVHVAGNKRKSMAVLRRVELEATTPKLQAALLGNIAEAISKKLSPDTPYTISALLPHLSREAQGALTHANKSRTINNAFGGTGVMEHQTDVGTLVRHVIRGGKAGTMFTLRPCASRLKAVSEAQPCG
jgi:hypothetical protein